MSTFERIYQIDPSRESDIARENISIALSDEEYLQKIRRDSHAINVGLGSFKIEGNDAKSESKTPKRKPKKNNPNPNKTAVARI